MGGRSRKRNSQTWEFLRPGLLETAKKFIDAEVKLRNRFPKLCTKGRECSIEADWDSQSGELTKKGSGDYEFKGSIDRVDTNGAIEASVVDYKLSGTNVNNFKSWKKGESLSARYVFSSY